MKSFGDLVNIPTRTWFSSFCILYAMPFDSIYFYMCVQKMQSKLSGELVNECIVDLFYLAFYLWTGNLPGGSEHSIGYVW